MAITNRQEFAEYCLRGLGGGVINIEISEDQLSDRVEEAIEYYTEYHYDGIYQDYVVKKIVGTSLTVADASVFNVGEIIYCTAKNISSVISEINLSSNTITLVASQHPFNSALAIGDVITNKINTQTITAITLGDGDKGYIELDNNVVGVSKIINLTSIISTGDFMFNAQYQIMMSEIQNLTSGGTQYLYGMMQYLGHLDYILRKERDFRFNRRMGKVYIDVNWKSDLKIGDYCAIEVYRMLDDSTYSKMLNDRWLKKYATALIKRQVAVNTKKYEGMALPGGLKYNSQQMFDEAEKEIQLLEDEAISSSAPLLFTMG